MHQYRNRLIVHTGSMFSGKTSALINDIRRFSIANYKVGVFKPTTDSRYSIQNVCSHDKIEQESHSIQPNHEYDIIKKVHEEGIHVVGIDEVQFFNEKNILNCINRLLLDDITVIVAGLDMDFQSQPFGIMKELMPIADIVNKHHAVCVMCGRDGWVSHRTTNEDERLVVGTSDKYIPLCRKCFSFKQGG